MTVVEADAAADVLIVAAADVDALAPSVIEVVTVVEADAAADVLIVAAADVDALAPRVIDNVAVVESDAAGEALIVAAADVDALAPRDIEKVAVVEPDEAAAGVAEGTLRERRVATLITPVVALATPASLTSQEYLLMSTALDIRLLGTRPVTLSYRKQFASPLV